MTVRKNIVSSRVQRESRWSEIKSKSWRVHVKDRLQVAICEPVWVDCRVLSLSDCKYTALIYLFKPESNKWDRIEFGERSNWVVLGIYGNHRRRPIVTYKIFINKCVSRTDTNPPFAFQTAFPRGTDFSVSTGRVKKLHTLLASLYF